MERFLATWMKRRVVLPIVAVMMLVLLYGSMDTSSVSAHPTSGANYCRNETHDFGGETWFLRFTDWQSGRHRHSWTMRGAVQTKDCGASQPGGLWQFYEGWNHVTWVGPTIGGPSSISLHLTENNFPANWSAVAAVNSNTGNWEQTFRYGPIQFNTLTRIYPGQSLYIFVEGDSVLHHH